MTKTTSAATSTARDHHLGQIRLHHLSSTPADHSPQQHGPTAWWADGTTSYVLHTRSGHVHGWTLADETDTVIQAVDSLRAGEEIGHGELRNALRDLRRLRTRLDAVEGELILYSRENGPQGRPRMSLREIGDALELHHSTVAERQQRMTEGETPAWRNWLVQNTDRDALYGGARPDGYQTPTLAQQVEEAPGGSFLAEAHPTDSNDWFGWVITVTDYRVGRDELLRVQLPDWTDFRPASAGHRLIEHGYQVLPVAHYEEDRAAGWKPQSDGSYAAPVYRLDSESGAA